MVGQRGRPPGKDGKKVVRKRLADGTVREYRYDRARYAKRKIVPVSGGIRQIADAFYASPEFRTLSDRWKTQIRLYVDRIEEEIGWMTLDDLAQRPARGEFYALRDAHADKPVASDRMMGVLSQLIGWAYERGMVAVNHAHGIPRLATGRSRSDRIWTPETEKMLLDASPPAIGALYMVALYTALRQEDLCRLDRSHLKEDGRWIEFTPAKTQRSTAITLWFPVFAMPPLDAVIKEAGDGPLLRTVTGKPWTRGNVFFAFDRARDAAGLSDSGLRFHDIRGTAITRMYEAGCTDAEVASISGHAIGGTTKLRDYAARTKRLALNAYRKWWVSMSGETGNVVSLVG